MDSARGPLVYIVDDDEAVRSSLGFLMKVQGYRYQSFESADGFLDQYDPERPAVGIFDIRMPRMSGLELFDELLERGSKMPVIFITGHGDVPMAVSALKKGAVDFITKPFDDDDLLAHIQDAIESLSISTERDAIKAKAQKALTTLTERERQVMEMVIVGNANKVIAYDLEVSQRTVEIHRANVMQKMECRSLAQLVRCVMIARSEI